jgi:GAF domain-containing protein
VDRREPYLVENAFVDPDHADSPLVRLEGTGSYAGVPLMTPSGQVLGAHCVISPEPQQFGADQVAVLHEAAAEIMALLERYRLDVPTRPWDQDEDDATWEPVETG